VSKFTNNHYVPQWYQRRFMQGNGKYHYLDLAPEVVVRDGSILPLQMAKARFERKAKDRTL